MVIKKRIDVSHVAAGKNGKCPQANDSDWQFSFTAFFDLFCAQLFVLVKRTRINSTHVSNITIIFLVRLSARC